LLRDKPKLAKYFSAAKKGIREGVRGMVSYRAIYGALVVKDPGVAVYVSLPAGPDIAVCPNIARMVFIDRFPMANVCVGV
jgi:hypothetical protein